MWQWFRKSQKPAHGLAALRRPLLFWRRVRPVIRSSRRRPAASVLAEIPVSDTALLPDAPTPFSTVAEMARRGPLIHPPPVPLDAAVRSRVRRWPVLVVNLLILIVAGDLGGSLYLREALGSKLFDRYRANLIPPTQSVVTDRGGTRVGTLAAAEAVREPIDEVPPIVVDALIRWEDARFHSHDGVDRYRIAGAFAALLKGDPQGGSTLTMQLAKLVKQDSARTMRRKLEDIALALALDERLGKKEVLRHYSNQAYFGGGVYGIAQACKYYFEKDRCEGLDLNQAAFLVSLLRAPAELSRDERRAWARRNAVMEQMREPLPPAAEAPRWEKVARSLFLRFHSVLDHGIAGRNDLDGRYDDAIFDPQKETALNLSRHRDPPTHPFVLETARLELQKALGSKLYMDGLSVRLTIDSRVQDAAEKAVGFGLENLRKLRAEKGEETAPDLDGGLVVVDPFTGDLLAYVPGADFSQSQVPFAARPIQVGSSLKPFVYAELLEQGGDLQTHILDSPICIGGWCPKNYDGKYHGSVTVEYALSHSLNTVAVRIADKVGVDNITGRLRLMGVQSQLTSNLPMALGASELTLLELGGLYASLFDGRVVRPRLVSEVRDRVGELMYGGAAPFRPRALQPSTVAQLHIAMGGVTRPGGTAAMMGRDLAAYFELEPDQLLGTVPGRTPQLACKTGTHDGFTRVGLGCVISDTDYGPLAVVTYVGHRTPKELGEGLTGGRIAGPIVGEFLKAVTARKRGEKNFQPFPDEMTPAWMQPAVDTSTATVASSESARPVRTVVDAAGKPVPAADATAAADAETSEIAPGHVPDAAPEGAFDAPIPGTGARLSAPREWPGLRVLDVDVVEAKGPGIVENYLRSGGTEADLAEVAPILGMDVESRAIHSQKLLERGFTERPLSERVLLLTDKITRSLGKMLDTRQTEWSYDMTSDTVHVVAESDGDRRLERVYTLDSPLRVLRTTRHHTSGRLLAVEWIADDGVRRAVIRRGDRMAVLNTVRVTVRSGALEKAWLGAGLSPAGMDGLRSLIGALVNIDRIQRGFDLRLMLADGGLLAVEATSPSDKWNAPPVQVAAVRTDGACLSHDGVPCARRLLPLPLAEARAYSRRGASTFGPVLVQKEVPGAGVVSPVSGKVLLSVPERSLLIVDNLQGQLVRLEGLRSEIPADQSVRAGDAVGVLDARGTLVYRAADDPGTGRLVESDALTSLSPVESSDAGLKGVAAWWRELHAWLRGDAPELRRAPQGT